MIVSILNIALQVSEISLKKLVKDVAVLINDILKCILYIITLYIIYKINL